MVTLYGKIKLVTITKTNRFLFLMQIIFELFYTVTYYTSVRFEITVTLPRRQASLLALTRGAWCCGTNTEQKTDGALHFASFPRRPALHVFPRFTGAWTRQSVGYLEEGFREYASFLFRENNLQLF